MWSWVLLLAFLMGFFSTAIVGIVLARRPRAPAWLLWIPSFVITACAWLGYAMSMRRVIAVLSGEAIERDVRTRILAEGTSESLSLLIFGSVYVAVLLTFALLFSGFRALRHGQRTRMGIAAILAMCGGFVLVVLVVPAAAVLAVRLGGSAAPLFFAVPTLLATVLAAAFVGAAMGGDSEPNAYAGPASDAWATLAMASAALVAWLGFGYVSSWATVFGATSGESVDPSQAARIYAEGMSEARAIWPTGAALLIPIGVSLVVPLLARPGPAASGLARAWSSLLFGAFIVVVLGVLPPVAVGSAQARIEASSAIPWPNEIDAVMVDRDAALDTVDGELLFYGKGRAWVGGAAQAAPLGTPAECAALVRRTGAHPGGAIAFGADSSTPASALGCVARAAQEALHPAEDSPYARRRGPIVFMVRVRTGLEPTSRLVTSGVRPEGVALGLADVPRGAKRLHLARSGWRFRSSPALPEQSGTGVAPTAYGDDVLVTFDPDLTAGELVPRLAAVHGKVTLGAADPAAFDPPPVGKWRARVKVDDAEGIDLPSAQLALEARRPALEQCEVDAARVLAPARYTVLTDGTLRAEGRPPTADHLATCVRVAILGASLPKPKKTAHVTVTVEFNR